MKLIALKDLPNRIATGEAFEEPDGRGQVLIRLGLAREDTEPESSNKRRRTYKRRDLQAEDASS